MRNLDGLTEALNGWWPTETDPKVSADYGPARFAPVVTAPPKAVAWVGIAEELELTIPADLDLASCDGGEYRLWVTHQGLVRTARAGERIDLRIADFRPGLLVVDASHQPDAPQAVVDQLDDARVSLSIVRP